MIEDVEEFGAGHLERVATDGAEHAQQFRALAVLRGRDLLQIVERPVQLVAVNVVNLEPFSSRPDKSFVHQMVAATVTEMTHAGIAITFGAGLRKGTKTRFEFSPVGVVEPSVCTDE